MRPSRTVSIAIVAIVLAACTAAPGSPSPSPTPSSSPSSLPSPSAAAGLPTPTPMPPDTDPVPDPLAVGHSIDCEGDGTTCQVHLVRDGVRDPAGWPVEIGGPCPGLRTAEDGLAYVACSPNEGATIHVIGLDGRPADGWPASVDGAVSRVSWNDFSIVCGVERSPIEVGPGGSVYVAISSGSAANVHAFDARGTPLAGWPQPIPGGPPGPDGSGGDGCRGFALNADGVVAWGYEDVEPAVELEARRTEFTSWSFDGRLHPGWPRGSEGAASGPVLDIDDGVTYVSASGRVWSHDDHGEVRPGWPYQLNEPRPPYVAPDGRIAVIEKVFEARDRMVLLRLDGTLVTGAPIELPADIETRCLFGDTPCAGATSPAFANDGTVYLSLAWSTTEHTIPDSTDMGGALVAFDADGAIVEGWPIDLAPRTHVLDLSVDLGDRLVARGYVCDEGFCGGEGTKSTTLTYSPDGELVEQTFED